MLQHTRYSNILTSKKSWTLHIYFIKVHLLHYQLLLLLHIQQDIHTYKSAVLCACLLIDWLSERLHLFKKPHRLFYMLKWKSRIASSVAFFILLLCLSSDERICVWCDACWIIYTYFKRMRVNTKICKRHDRSRIIWWLWIILMQDECSDWEAM